MDQVEACFAQFHTITSCITGCKLNLKLFIMISIKLACVLCMQSCAGLINTGAHVSVCISMNKEPE